MKKPWRILLALLTAILVFLLARSLTRGPLSLRRLDDHPLYVMHYAGDYGFDQYLQTGVYPSQPASSAAEVETEAWGCTVFAALNPAGERLLGRNFDWYADHPALLLFTDPPDGYASVAMVDLWYLDYTGDSIGLFERQNLSRAPYLPFDGMNEMGVAVGMMALPYGNGMRDPALRTLEDLDVIRLVLDFAASVDQAIELLNQYNVRFSVEIPLHYLIADASGESAVIEYVAGEMRVLRNEQSWQVATNFIISEEQPQGASSSCRRYNKAYQTLEDQQGSLTSPQALALLEGVSQSGSFPTIWSVLYNLTTGEISVVMDRNYQEIYTFQLKRNLTP
jgi:hypothetical protein